MLVRRLSGPACPDRSSDDPGTLGGEDPVEGSGELRVAIADGELGRGRLFGELHREVASLLGHPASDRLGGHGGDPPESRLVGGEREHVEPTEKDSEDVGELARRQSLRLGGEELRPTRSRGRSRLLPCTGTAASSSVRKCSPRSTLSPGALECVGKASFHGQRSLADPSTRIARTYFNGTMDLFLLSPMSALGLVRPVRVTLAAPMGVTPEVAKTASWPAVERVEQERSEDGQVRLTVWSRDTTATTPALLTWTFRRGYRILSMKTEPVTLEDVFRALARQESGVSA